MANIDERIAQMQAQLRQLQASARKQKRRDETRRKIVYGAAVLLSDWLTLIAVAFLLGTAFPGVL